MATAAIEQEQDGQAEAAKAAANTKRDDRARTKAMRDAAKAAAALTTAAAGEATVGRYHIEYRAIRDGKWLFYGGRNKPETAVGWINKRADAESKAKYRVVDSKNKRVLHMGDGSKTFASPSEAVAA